MSYFPRSDNAVLDWVMQLIRIIYDPQNYERWGLMKPSDEITEQYNDFSVALANCKTGNRRPVEVLAKNVARKKLEKTCRDYVQGYLARNVKVTEQDRFLLGLPQRDTIPTNVLDPTGQAELTITYPARTQLMVHIKPVVGTQVDPRAYYGCRVYFGVYDYGATLPGDGTELRESLFTRRKKELFTFLPKDSGKTACFCVRYENSKGKAGPWGAMASAVIP